MRSATERINAQPDFTIMSPEDLHANFKSWYPAGSGFVNGIICKLILDICKLRNIDTTNWY